MSGLVVDTKDKILTSVTLIRFPLKIQRNVKLVYIHHHIIQRNIKLITEISASKRVNFQLMTKV